MVGGKTWFRCLVIISTGSTRMCWTNLYVCPVAASFTSMRSGTTPIAIHPTRILLEEWVGGSKALTKCFLAPFSSFAIAANPLKTPACPCGNGLEADIILPQ